MALRTLNHLGGYVSGGEDVIESRNTVAGEDGRAESKHCDVQKYGIWNKRKSEMEKETPFID